MTVKILDLEREEVAWKQTAAETSGISEVLVVGALLQALARSAKSRRPAINHERELIR